jgi:hypothetical protein
VSNLILGCCRVLLEWISRFTSVTGKSPVAYSEFPCGDKLECLCFTAFSPLEAGFYNFLRFHYNSGPVILEPSFSPFQAYPERLYTTVLSLWIPGINYLGIFSLENLKILSFLDFEVYHFKIYLSLQLHFDWLHLQYQFRCC